MTSGTGRTLLEGSEPPTQAHAALVGRAQPAQNLSVSLYLRPKSDWVSKGDSSTQSGQRSREELAERFGASPQEAVPVERFAAEYGLEVDDVDLGSRRITLRGTVARLERAFGVQLYEYRGRSGNYISPHGPVSLPKDLAPAVVAVLGLDTRPVATPHSS